MAVTKTTTQTNMSSGTTGFRAWRLKMASVSITGWTNHPTGAYAYETLTTSGATISSAINTSGYGIATTNSISCTGGRIYRVKMTLTLNSGTIPYFRMVSSTGSASWSLASTVVAGTYTYSLAKGGGVSVEYWFCPTNAGTYYIELASMTTSNFAVSAFSCDEWTPTLITDTVAWDYFTDTAGVGDALLFCSPYLAQMPHGLWFQVGTALSASAITTEWKYSQADSDKFYNEVGAQHSITLNTLTVTDNTNNFQTTGQNTITWTPPTDIGVAYLSALTPYASRFIVCGITALTSLTEGGANATNASKVNIDSIDATVYASGTITSVATTSGYVYRIADSTKNWAVGELRGRHFWLTSGNGVPNMYVIRDNGQSHFDIGIPHNIELTQGRTVYLSTACAVNDTYAIGHTLMDIYNADVAGSWGLVTASEYVPQWKKYKSYYCKADILVKANTPNVAFFGTWGEVIGFNDSYSIGIGGTGTLNMASGIRSMGYDQSLTYKPSNELTFLGSEFWYNSYGYTSSGSKYVRGNIYSTKFTNNTKYSFANYLYAQGDWRNTQIDALQIQNLTSALTGFNMIHYPAEPERAPIAGLFKLTNYKNCGAVACLYATSAQNYYLDSPYTDSYYAFQSYTGWTDAYTAEILDKHPDTPFGFNTTLSGTAGTWKFYYRLNIKVVDEEGNPIEDADIVVKNASGTTQFTDTTDSTGNATGNSEIGDYPVTNKILYGYKQATVNGYSTSLTGTYGPFEITITKDGYETYIDNSDITMRRDLKITLKKALDTMVVIGGEIYAKADPTNSTEDRDILIVK